MAEEDASAFNDSNQENSRKLFVGGLSWETTSDSLRAYMSRYGEVVDCSVKVDVSTGRSRGFGFVMFKTQDEADMVLKTRPHMLDGKIIDPKKAVGISKSGMPITKKIFVGGVRSETTDDALKEYFSQFGAVHSLDFPIDHTTSKRRGFCFLEFDEPDAAERAMAVSFHSIGSQTVEVKPAYTKEQQQALMARGLWPPSSGSKQGFSLDIGASDPSMQAAFKGLMGPGAKGDLGGQMNQMAAAALFYQTYFQYALALSAASNVSVNNVPNVPQVSNEGSVEREIEDKPSYEDSNRSPDHRPRRSPARRPSPRRESRREEGRRERTRRERSRSTSERRRRRTSRSPSPSSSRRNRNTIESRRRRH